MLTLPRGDPGNIPDGWLINRQQQQTRRPDHPADLQPIDL